MLPNQLQVDVVLLLRVLVAEIEGTRVNLEIVGQGSRELAELRGQR
jgi:hypothetical protein